MTRSVSATAAPLSGKNPATSLRTQAQTARAQTGPVVLAASGMSELPSTISIAQLIAAKLGIDLNVISVVPPVLLYGVPPEIQTQAFAIDRMALDERKDAISKMMSASTMPGVAWKAEVLLGQPAAEICSAATAVDATLIVVGASPQRRRHHIVAGQRAAQILHGSTVPVLSVAPWMKSLPSKIVAAIDFNPASLFAAETAARLLQKGGSIVLVHVVPPTFIYPGAPPLAELMRTTAAKELDVVAARVRTLLPESTKVETLVLTGEAGTEILELADRIGADLIANGTRGQSAIRRVLVGSVATELFHTAATSVLACPPPSIARQVALALDVAGTVVASDERDFAEVLDLFSRSNAGSSATIEEDDPIIGAQIQARGYKLLGVAFDRKDRRVDIMLGSESDGDVHFTRSISKVKSIAVTRLSADGGAALQVEHESAKTLLVIARPPSPG